MAYRQIEGINTGFRSLNEEVSKLNHQLAWVRLVKRNRDQLDCICDIVQLGCLWSSELRCRKGEPPELRLEYTGAAKNHLGAAEDLGRIMDALKCTDLHIGHTGSWSSSRPHGQYKGEGKLGDEAVKIVMDVKWLPPNCHVSVANEHKSMHTERTYSVYCRR
jgi:hypothetical protein